MFKSLQVRQMTVTMKGCIHAGFRLWHVVMRRTIGGQALCLTDPGSGFWLPVQLVEICP
jgi:hypothetical protein